MEDGWDDVVTERFVEVEIDPIGTKSGVSLGSIVMKLVILESDVKLVRFFISVAFFLLYALLQLRKQYFCRNRMVSIFQLHVIAYSRPVHSI